MSEISSFQSEYGSNSDIIHNTNDTIHVGELDSLIRILSKKLRNNDPQIKYIKYPKLLISSLMELKMLVGMDRLKDSIALQVMRLVDGANNGETSTKMLNTILYGPPGVGKTKVGIILAKIWFSLGYLNKPNIGSKQNIGSNIPGTETYINSNGEANPLIFLGLLLFIYLIGYLISGVTYLYRNIGLIWMFVILLSVVVLFAFMYFNNKTYTYITNVVKNNSDSCNSGECGLNMSNGESKIVNDRDIIKVVSRQDFVAEYVGQTATKTKALLYSNMGKVLFIDEAYSLINGERDPFGMEALTTLNLFMSEHPDSIAIIFAGYKDIMKNGIFKYQPGLPRRCMWHFECEGYNGNQLSDIFYRQVLTDGWKIKSDDKNAINRLIRRNESLFKAYGGDTERLVFFSQLEASRNNVLFSDSSQSNCTATSFDTIPDTSDIFDSLMSSSSDVNRKTITYDHVKRGLERLKDNNISSM